MRRSSKHAQWYSNRNSVQRRNKPNDDRRTRGISSRFFRRCVLDKSILFFPAPEHGRLISRANDIVVAREYYIVCIYMIDTLLFVYLFVFSNRNEILPVNSAFN